MRFTAQTGGQQGNYYKIYSCPLSLIILDIKLWIFAKKKKKQEGKKQIRERKALSFCCQQGTVSC